MSPEQETLLDDPHRVLWVGAGTKTGKVSPLDSTVFRGDGPVRLGDISLGDVLKTPDGEAEVIGIYPQGEMQMYEIGFCDGSTVEVGDPHLWEVEHPRYGRLVVDTAKLISWQEKDLPRFKRVRVPAISPVEFNSKDVPIPPYLLGLLLGDGCLTQSTISFAGIDNDILDAVAELSDGLGEFVRSDDRHHRFRGARVLKDTLGELGLLGKYSHEKFIPDVYIWNSIAVRMGILAGILDTDGWVSRRRGVPVLEQTSERLAKNVETIVQSLGGHVTTKTKIGSYRDPDGCVVKCKKVYRQNIVLRDPTGLFRLKRKSDLCKKKVKSGQRTFRYIKPSRVTLGQCIEVDSERHLYLMDNFIPTHNTVACAVWDLEGLLQGERVAWVGPWYKRTRLGYQHICGFLKDWISAGFAKASDVALTIDVLKTTSGRVGHLECFSGETYDVIYGEAFDRVVIDEATRHPEGVFHAARSTVTATGGKIRIAFNTDRGARHWAIREFFRAQRGDEPTYGWLTMPTSSSPYVLPEDIEQARRTLPNKVFEALYNAKVTEDGASVFQDVRKCIAGTLMEPFPGRSYVVGVDLARRHDYTVISVMDRGARHLVYHKRLHGQPWRAQREVIKDVAKRYNNAKVYGDSTGVGDPNIEELQHDGVNAEGVHLHQGMKRDLIEKLIVAIENTQITFPYIDEIISELETFEYAATAKGAVQYQAPEGFHDDCVVSLALAVYGLGDLRVSLPTVYSELTTDTMVTGGIACL